MKNLLLFFLTLITLNAFSEMDPKSVKKLKKAEKLQNSGKFDDAEKIYKDILKEYPYYSSAWNAYTEMAYERYSYMKQSSRGFKITVNGVENSNDSLSQSLASLLKALDPAALYFEKFIDVCREATLKSEYATHASFYLRNSYYDKKVDLNISDSAKKEFAKAERKFTSHNYTEAIEYYQKAIAIDSHYYKAKLYVGDSYYALKDYVSSITYFRKAIEEEPTLIEPRKYLVDALVNINAYEEAYEECIKILMLYPDIGMFIQLENIAPYKKKTFDRKWAYRQILPNEKSNAASTANNGGWEYYRKAKSSFDTSYYDKKTGVIKPNPVTQQKYLEVYCWEQMLKDAPADKFTEARKMQEKGQLDSYVLFSLFHHDTKDQFIHLSKNNRPHLREYIDLLMN